MTLDQYRKHLGWSWNRLAQEARLDKATVQRASRGDPIRGDTATQLARAISEGLGYHVHFSDIDGLNVQL